MSVLSLYLPNFYSVVFPDFHVNFQILGLPGIKKRILHLSDVKGLKDTAPKT